MGCRDGGLDLQRAGRSLAQSRLEQDGAFGNEPAIPAGTVLMLKCDGVTVLRDPRLAA